MPFDSNVAALIAKDGEKWAPRWAQIEPNDPGPPFIPTSYQYWE